MYDLIYELGEYEKEFKSLFTDAEYSDASDEVHENRISIKTNIDKEEYFRIIILNGFGGFSLGTQLFLAQTHKKTLSELYAKWELEYPQFFKINQHKN